jgi:hypothetical protein
LLKQPAEPSGRIVLGIRRQAKSHTDQQRQGGASTKPKEHHEEPSRLLVAAAIGPHRYVQDKA